MDWFPATDPRSAPVHPGRHERFGQLTYTSVDGRGAGGWQITDARGLTPSEQELLRARIDPQLETGLDLPRFPAPDEVARLPRRLVFGPIALPPELPPAPAAHGAAAQGATTGVAWWHHAPAGLDGSGRPGNVFTHVVLDRQPDNPVGATVSDRPIDWWRSAGWLTPFGAAEVRDTVLPARPPAPAGAGAGAVAAFLLDPRYYRLGVLAALLDACAGALGGGRPVALATRDTDSAAQWVAAVTHLMAAATARHLSFSTLERGGSLAKRREQGVLLCCFPIADYSSLLEQHVGDVVLLAEDDDVRLGDLDGEPHLTRAGDRIPVTEWSVMARVALIDAQSAHNALAGIDALSARVAVEEELDALVGEPGWPLALVVAHQQGDLVDASTEAVAVLLRRGVAGLRGDPELRSAVQRLVDEVAGTTTREIWDRLKPLAQSGSALSDAAEPLLERYVICAVADQTWLTAATQAPVPDGGLLQSWHASATCRAAVLRAIGELGDRPESDERAMNGLLRLADFLIRLGLADDSVVEALSVAFERALVPALFSDGPVGSGSEPTLVQHLGAASEPVLDVVRSLVNQKLNEIRLAGHRQLFGRFLTPDVLKWLYPTPSTPVALEGVILDDVRLRAERARVLVLSDPVSFAHERPLAVLTALSEAWTEAELAPLLAGQQWTLQDLLQVEQRCSGMLPLRLFVPAFAAAPDALTLDDAAGTVIGNRFLSRRRVDPRDEAVLRMRQQGQRLWWQSPRLTATLADLLAGGLRTLDDPQIILHEDAVDHLQAAILLAVLVDQFHEEVQGLLAEERLRSSTARPRVDTMVSEGCQSSVPLEDVILVAVIGDPAFPHTVARRADTWAASIQVSDDAAAGPLLQEYVRRRLSDGADSDQMLRRVNHRLQPMLRDSALPERTARATSRFVQSWLRALSPRDSLLHRFRNAP